MKFLTLTRMYLAKAIKSFRFWCAVVLYIGLLTIISQDIISENSDISYIFHYAFSNSTSYFLLVICALPNAAVFAEEWAAKRFISVYVRAKKIPFSASMIVSSFLSAFLVSLTATVLYFIFLSFNYPIEFQDIQQRTFIANSYLLLSGNYFLYYASKFLTQACLMGLFSAFSTMFSVKLTEASIAIVMPMILYIAVTNVSGLFSAPAIVDPYLVYSSRAYIQNFLFPDAQMNFSVISMLYPAIYTLFFLAFFIVVTNFWIKRKYENCNDIG